MNLLPFAVYSLCFSESAVVIVLEYFIQLSAQFNLCDYNKQ